MRTKKVFYNAITGIIPQLIIGVLGFVKIKFFINIFGVELNGLMQLFAQIFAYLSLAEGGIGAAVQYKLYKMLVDKNYDGINKLLKGAKQTFRKIGYIIIFISLILLFRLDIFIKNNPFDLRYIQLAFFLYLISSVISYFYVSDRILLSSDQKLYKVNLIFNSFQILKFVLEIILILIGTNIFILIGLYIIINFLSFNVLRFIVKKEYEWYDNKNVEADFSFKEDIKHLFPHKIINTVAKSTDMIVISSFLGIVETGIYGVYNYIINFFVQIIDQISSSFFSIIGNFNVQESKEKTKLLFDRYSVFLMILSNVLCIPLLLTFNSFIALWVGKKMLVDFVTVILFVFVLYYRIIMVPIGTFVSVNGLFKETKISAIIEATINIVLSIILVNFWGIKGVLLATLISMFASSLIYYPRVLFKKVFKSSLRHYYEIFTKNLLISSFIFILLFSLSKIMLNNVTNLFVWFVYGTIIFIINFFITIFFYRLLFKEEFLFIASKIRRGKHEKNNDRS